MWTAHMSDQPRKPRQFWSVNMQLDLSSLIKFVCVFSLGVFCVASIWGLFLAPHFFTIVKVDGGFSQRPVLGVVFEASVLSLFALLISFFAGFSLVRRSREETLNRQAAEARYASIVHAEPQCVKVMDRAGRLLDMNPAGLAIIDATSMEEVYGLEVSQLVVPADREAFDKLLEEVFQGKSGTLEFQIKTLKGNHKTMSTHAVPLQDADGDVQSYMAVTYDITQQKADEIALREANQIAEQANKQLKTFLANVSHELRTPLNAIIGFSQLIQTEAFGPIGDKKYVEYLEGIHQSGRQLHRLVEDLLDISKLEAGVIHLNRSDVDVSKTARTAIARLSNKVKAKRLSISCDLDARRKSVFADEIRVQQMVDNLLDNAIKFSRDGGEIAVSLNSFDDESIALTIADNGIGMDQATLLQIREPFSRSGDPFTRVTDGAGLGLSIVSELAKLHGAAFEIESNVGSGTKVHLTFPPNCGEAISGDPSNSPQ